MRRIVVVALIVMASLVLAGCGSAVPDVRGMTAAQAEKALGDAGFLLSRPTYDEKATGAQGAIVGQAPAAGALAKAGSAVAVTVAGASPVAAPNLNGLDKAAAEAALTAAGLKLGIVTESFADTMTAGKVASQDPPVGNDAVKGSAVDVVISKGPRPIAVPAVVGKKEADATALLKAAGFAVSPSSRADAAAKGTVVAQTPPGGEAQPGSAIQIVVSSGVQLVRVPKLYGLAYDEAESKLKALGFRFVEKINAETMGPTGGVSVAEVYKQSPKAGAMSPRGSTVTIWFQIYE